MAEWLRGVIYIMHNTRGLFANPKEKVSETRVTFCVFVFCAFVFPFFLLGYDWLQLDLLSILEFLPKLELRSWPHRARTVAGGVSALAAVWCCYEDLYLGL